MTDFGCAILAFASSRETIHRLLRRLVENIVIDDDASSMPWTIVNKYYKADVQFVSYQLSTWTANRDELEGAPAVVFVWSEGEPYKEQVHKLSKELLSHEFEVVLAVRLPPTDPSSSVESEDEQEIDSYLSSLGFEFVDAVTGDALPASGHTDDAGIRRIIDALSTIMWPSMVQHPSKHGTSKSFFDIARGGMPADTTYDLSRFLGARSSVIRDDRIRRELEELEQWLDEDTPGGDRDPGSDVEDSDTDPWSTVVTAGTTTPYARSETYTNSRPTTPKTGFDDDFTSFVSASSALSIGGAQRPSSPGPLTTQMVPHVFTSFSSTFSFTASSGRSTPAHEHEQESFDTSHLTPGDTSFDITYRSLGSVSDFGDPDGDKSFHDHQSADDIEDEDIPSSAEIAETSRRIFGSAPLSLSPTDERSTHQDSISAINDTANNMQPEWMSAIEDKLDEEVMDEDLERFDLQSVLSALQGFKEEIAGMPDKERRKAAARVALGLAYGLDSRTRGKSQA